MVTAIVIAVIVLGLLVLGLVVDRKDRSGTGRSRSTSDMASRANQNRIRHRRGRRY